MIKYCNYYPFKLITVKTENDPISKIIQGVCNYFSITENKLKSPSHTRFSSDARSIAMTIIKKTVKGSTYRVIGLMFNRDHSTAIHNYNKSEELIETDKKYRADYETIYDLITE